MYVPHFNAIEDEQQVRAMVAAIGSAQLVTVGRTAIRWPPCCPSSGRATRSVRTWLAPTRTGLRSARVPVLLVVAGPQAYISPSWYASKTEHGRVVPTSNYSAVQIVGRAWTRQDPDWLRGAVDDLVERHEAR